MSAVHRPAGLAELLDLAGRIPGRKHFLAGGTDLAVQRRGGTLAELDTIALPGIPELSGIETRGGFVRIGALSTITGLLRSPLVRERLPLLADSLRTFASPQIRSIATLGGNICNGSPTADTVPPLLAMDAEVELLSTGGARRLALGSFFTGYKRNALREEEILAAVLIPADALAGYETFHRKVGARATMTIAKLSVALALRRPRPANGAVLELRVAVGSLNEYPRRLTSLEALLRGADPAAVGAARIEDAVRSQVTPISDFRSDARYRERVCLNLILDVLGLAQLQSAAPE